EPRFECWLQLGRGMPNAPVFDLDYDASDDVLAAGTLGRGAWTLAGVAQLGAECGCFPCSSDGRKEAVCHIPRGNVALPQTICIRRDAVAAHLMNHGDHCGPCR